MGNICRSPLAEAILRRQAFEMEAPITVDSAGTDDWHIGELSDHRAIKTGEARGYEMTHRARQVKPRDFEEFDLIVVMDHDNLSALNHWPGSKPEKIRLARSFDPDADSEIVPDPYYGNEQGFDAVVDQLEPACRGILAHLIN
jgi:protein-tyrosine phosphatase